MAGKPPTLKSGQARKFLAHFAPDHQLKGHKAKGVARDGKPFVIELEHSMAMRPDILQKALGYLGIDRKEFWAWYEGGQRTTRR